MDNLLKPDFDAIPQFLRDLPYWSAWPAIPRPNGKITKPPLGINGKFNKSNDTNGWVNFHVIRKFYEDNQNKTFHYTDQGKKYTTKIAGVGILLDKSFSLVGIDFDNVIDAEGNFKEWAKPFIQELETITYCEFSPSGKGIHAFILGEKPEGRCKHGDLEIYDNVRFLTITGHKLPNCPNEPGNGDKAQAIINKLLAYISNNEKEISTRERVQEPKKSQFKTDTLSDSELIAKARKAKNGRFFSALFDGDTSKYPSDSEADIALCNMLAFWTRKDGKQMDRLMRQSGLLKREDRLTKWDKIHCQGATYGEWTIGNAIQSCTAMYEPHREKTKKETAKKTITLPDTGKPKIIYRPGELPRLVKELENSIRGKAWQRDTLIVRIVNLPEKKSYHGLRMSKGTSIISPFDVSDLMLLANKCADWIKIKTTQKSVEEIPIDPPQTVLQAFLSDKGGWTLPPLSGLVTCPILRPDGSILNKPGYDQITGLYADFDAKNFPLVEANPTKENAQNALIKLKDAISEFSFKNDVDRAVALAAMLTTVLRPSVKSAPLFAFSAPTPGTGKSTLANVIGIIATGKTCAAMDFNRDEAEFKKAVFASLLEGSPVTLIDNIMGDFNSSLLNIVLSEETIKGRILGLSKNASLPTNSLWLATGNNLTICGDLTRRTLICTLDAEVERPAEREFQRKNLEKWIVDHRGELVAAALTILRAYHVAGKPIPDGMKPMNGYNDWSHFIRGSLEWLGEADPKDSQLAIEAHDPEREALSNVLHAWYEYLKENEKREEKNKMPVSLTAKELVDKDYIEQFAPPKKENTDKKEDIDNEDDKEPLSLSEALREAVSCRGELTAKQLGKWLAKYEGRVIKDMRFLKVGNHQRAILWRLYKA